MSDLELKISKLKNLRVQARALEREIEKDLFQLERDTYGGLRYDEHTSKLQDTEYHEDGIDVKIFLYKVYGTYKLNDEIILKAETSLYADQTYVKTSVYYVNNDRVVDGAPKKYEKEFEKLITIITKYKVSRVSKPYMEELNLSMHYFGD